MNQRSDPQKSTHPVHPGAGVDRKNLQISNHNVDQSDGAIGEIIRRQNNLTPEQIEQIVLFQRERGLKFGEAAVALNFASERDVLWALSQQFHYPYAAGEAHGFPPELVVAANPFGVQSESFRDLRSQLMLGVLDPDQSGARALSIISPDIGDGKTFFAANLAIAFSQLGGRTLLVDADMRTPRLQEIFRISVDYGLSSLLSGRSVSNAIQAVPQLPSLFVLPVGTVPPNPLELVQRPAFTLLMHELLEKFDFVIVDTPAFAHGSDARVIASKCGAALAVARRNKTRMRTMQQMLDSLRKGSLQLAGVVINEY
jgi:chain length determinant protein tyrosine kinase EpsG